MTPVTRLVNGVQLPLYVLRKISDKSVINPSAISNTTGLPNPGPDQEYLPILTDPIPDNDQTFTIRKKVEGPNETNLTWEIKYTVEDRPKSEQLTAVDNAKRFEVQKHFPSQDAWESIVIMVAAFGREIKGLALTDEEKKAEDRLVAVAAKLTENIGIVADMKAAIEQGQKPDLSESAWATVDAVEVVNP